MSNDSMGNLEKLGILVIVILVVVVGVVAITPSDTLFGPDQDQMAGLPEHPDDIRPLPMPDPDPQRSVDPAPDPWIRSEELSDEPVLPPWPDPDDVTPTAETRPSERVTQIPPQPPAPQPEPLVAPPSFREITVQRNDSLWVIAERELGSGADWKKIAAANPGIDPDRLRLDQRLRIPLATSGGGNASGENASGENASGENASGGGAARRSSDEPVRPAPGGVRTHVVRSGDTPMGLSEKFYGRAKHYRFLMEHNGLEDANDLQKDMTIEVPPLPETHANVAPVRGSSSSAAPAGRFYEVRKGDNPTKIARDQLGDATRWREILELNGIADDRGLIAGTRIRLPE